MNKKKTKRSKSEEFWPSLQLLEFTMGLSKLMEKQEIGSQAELARLLSRRPSWISSVLSGQENLRASTMLELAAALGGTFHIGVTDDHGPFKMVRDVVEEHEKAPDLSLGWPELPRSPLRLVVGNARKPTLKPTLAKDEGSASPPPVPFLKKVSSG